MGLAMAINGDLDLTFGSMVSKSDLPCHVYMRRTLLEIVELCADRNVPLVLIPEMESRFVLNPDLENPVREVFEAGAAHRRDSEVFYLDISDSFDADMVSAYFVDSEHLNDEGYAYLAMVIEETLDSLELLPPSVDLGPIEEPLR